MKVHYFDLIDIEGEIIVTINGLSNTSDPLSGQYVSIAYKGKKEAWIMTLPLNKLEDLKDKLGR